LRKVCDGATLATLISSLYIVSSALTNFTNVTLSSLYFDIIKDSLYADAEHSHSRKTVIFVLQQVSIFILLHSTQPDSIQILTTLQRTMGPILPHLAEEIHETLHEGTPLAEKSVFQTQWVPLVSGCVCSSSGGINGMLRIALGRILLLQRTWRY
jgi:isoleucyl-tRNA synthetase